MKPVIFAVLSIIGLQLYGQSIDLDSNTVIIKPEKKEIYQRYDSIYQVRIKAAELNGIYIPKDLFDAFSQLDKLMDEDAKKMFMSYTDEEVDRKI